MSNQGIWESVISTAKSVLPNSLGFLANAIIPGTGGMAASLIADVLEVEPTPQAITAGLQNATTEQIQQITAEANRHKENLFGIGLEGDKLVMRDRQDARQRQVASEKATGKKDINLYALSYLVVFGFFGLVGFLMFQKLPEGNMGPVNQLFGAIATGFGMVLQYFFGSSKSSADKTSLMAAKK